MSSSTPALDRLRRAAAAKNKSYDGVQRRSSETHRFVGGFDANAGQAKEEHRARHHGSSTVNAAGDRTSYTPPARASSLTRLHSHPKQHVKREEFGGRPGFVTEADRLSWTKKHEGGENAPHTFEYDPDIAQPLYFWQLHSLLGPKRIQEMVTVFYTSVFNDPNEDFRNVFAKANTLENSIWAQSAYWIDSMGGGTMYFGGLPRLNFQHEQDHVKCAMTRENALKWMEHMNTALDKAEESGMFMDDPRVRPCIVDFVQTHMSKYGSQFDFDAKGLCNHAKRAGDIDCDSQAARARGGGAAARMGPVRGLVETTIDSSAPST
eukprot:CAMPEP_0206257880 /NCGR_PEP_ID=MMETSP0047_2-20121206/25596_1 /ASSEMBLY_ACC=CAM_ASM_000192 /TAXON_ID=195065 /ORGANISM="Chroomonas mesostigmatica_cf, Strain CCMP1168" /LENGTH=320 /DNA_ID=CAMNT_0053684535 /DNA_START=99 /DNA_END=1062 /DNA_ORIENTATION=-